MSRYDRATTRALAALHRERRLLSVQRKIIHALAPLSEERREAVLRLLAAAIETGTFDLLAKAMRAKGETR